MGLLGGGLIFNRAPALLRHSVCVFRVPRPKPRLPEKVGTPLRKPARVVRGGARPHPWRTEGEGLGEVARCALCAGGGHPGRRARASALLGR
jgi:hypothetical protein